MSTPEILKLENEIMEMNARLSKLRAEVKPTPVKNYSFATTTGKVTLLDLFAGKETLFVIHNMGQGCRYCTLWADGFNAWVPHLEDRFGVALVSKDNPELQRRFANSRGWRFNMVSHGGGEYAKEQTPAPGQDNCPGMVVYTRQGDQIFRKSSTTFGPGDAYCSFWSVLSLAGLGEDQVHPQFRYWKAPEKLDDGGKNVI
jgi:predicted dithiol-disulfide oxidoreductase (DUF899 family)